jgi:integrase
MTADAGKNRRSGKRASGEGTIYERNGRWYGSVQINGDRRWLSGKDRKTVVAQIAECRQQAERGMLPPREKLTIEQFCERWLADVVIPARRKNTSRTYAKILRNHAYPGVGNIKLRDLRPAHLARLNNEVRAKGVSESTVRQVHTTLQTALAQAVEWGEIPTNVAERITPPRRDTREMRPLTREEAQILRRSADERSDPLAPLWRFLIDTGCRIGEALAVRWEDLDLLAGRVKIRRTLVDIDRGGAPTFGEPKTSKGQRSITLMPSTVAALRAHRLRQHEHRLRLGPDWPDYDLVFCTSVGTALYRMNAHRALKQALRRAGLPDIRLHDLRHTCATLLLEAGENPRVVADRLGHSDVALTLRLYAHVTENMEAGAADRLARVLDG